jgi:hypothetical protein
MAVVRDALFEQPHRLRVAGAKLRRPDLLLVFTIDLQEVPDPRQHALPGGTSTAANSAASASVAPDDFDRHG